MMIYGDNGKKMVPTTARDLDQVTTLLLCRTCPPAHGAMKTHTGPKHV